MRCHTLEYHDIVAGDDFEASGFGGASAASYKLGRASFTAHLGAIAAAGVDVGRVDGVGTRGRAPVLLTSIRLKHADRRYAAAMPNEYLRL